MKAKIANSKCLNILGDNDLFSSREILTGVLKSWLKNLGYYSIFTAFACDSNLARTRGAG